MLKTQLTNFKAILNKLEKKNKESSEPVENESDLKLTIQKLKSENGVLKSQIAKLQINSPISNENIESEKIKELENQIKDLKNKEENYLSQIKNLKDCNKKQLKTNKKLKETIAKLNSKPKDDSSKSSSSSDS